MISPNSSSNPLVNSTETDTEIVRVFKNNPYSVISPTEQHINSILYT